MNTFEYHQFLKYIYFEGYADSYEDAEYLLEEFDDDEYEELCEKFVKAMDTRRRGPDHRTRFPEFAGRDNEFDPKFTRKRVGVKQDGEDIDPYFRGRKRRKTERRQGVGGRSFTNGSEDDENVNENLKIHNIIVDYLLDEGYTNSYESAEIILENMSDAWFDMILEEPFQIYGPDPHGPSDAEPKPLGKPYKNKKRAKTRADELDQEIGGYRHFVRKVDEEFKDLTPEKEERVKNRLGDLARTVQVQGAQVKQLRNKPFAKHRPGIKQQIKDITNSAKKNANLAQNATDALIRTSVGRSANLQSRINDLKNR